MGVFFRGVGANHDLKKGGPPFGAINHLVGRSFIREAVAAKKRSGVFSWVFPLRWVI